jgi:AcrR family transcriptional regulator
LLVAQDRASRSYVSYHANMSDANEGLRAIKKRMTHDQIADAAYELTVDQGLEHVTIEEVAHMAFVSPRTISNYFSCKEAAVVAAGDTLPEIVEEYAKAPNNETPLAVLRRVVISVFANKTRDQLGQARKRLQLIEQYPILRSFLMASYGEAERDLRTIISDRTGTDVNSDVYPTMVADAAVSAVRTALGLWALGDGDDQWLVEHLTTAFDLIDSGMSRPRTAGRSTIARPQVNNQSFAETW